MIFKPHYLFWRALEKTFNMPLYGSSRSKHIFVACFPKSGSTYFTHFLAEYTGFMNRMLVYRGVHNEQFINEFKLRMLRHINTVTQQHAKGTERNIYLLNKYSIKPVILVRNIFDVVFSIKDHYRREDTRNPMSYVHVNYQNMTEEEQLVFIVRNCIPWYFSFLLSWAEASEKIDSIWIRYEDLFADQIGTISRILDFQEIPADPQKIQKIITSISGEKTRFNKGVSGRGKNLPLSAKQALIDIADCWKVDDELLARIGIDKESRKSIF